MKNPQKPKSLSRRKPLKKEKRTVEPSKTTKLQSAFKEDSESASGDSEEPVQPVKRISKGADEEME